MTPILVPIFVFLLGGLPPARQATPAQYGECSGVDLPGAHSTRPSEGKCNQCHQVSCEISPESPGSIPAGERVKLSANARGTGNLSYSWSTNAGTLSSPFGKDVVLDTTGIQGEFTITLNVSTDEQVNGEACPGSSCSISMRILTVSPPFVAPIGGGDSKPLESAISFLVRGRPEESGFGLYSYVLLRRPLDEIEAKRNLLTIQAILLRLQRVSAFLRAGVARPNLNVTYLPVITGPTASPTPQWVIDHYDFDFAELLLGQDAGPGPFIISVLNPITVSRAMPEHYLYQNMSRVPPRLDLLALWIREFTRRASQKYFWDDRIGPRFALELRTDIAIVAESSEAVYPSWIKVKKFVSTIIGWK